MSAPASACVCLKHGAVRCGVHGWIDDAKRTAAARGFDLRRREVGLEPEPEPRPVEVHPLQEQLEL